MIPGRLYRWKGAPDSPLWGPKRSSYPRIGRIDPTDILIFLEKEDMMFGEDYKVVSGDQVGWIVFSGQVMESKWFEEAVSD